MNLVNAIAVALLVVGCNGGGKDSAPGGGQGPFGGAQVAIAKRMVDKLAFEAYPQWAVQSNSDRCPALADLQPFLDGAPTDPWGRPLRLRCDDLPPGAHGIAVWSVGPDGKDATDDDVHSWDR